GYFVDSKGATLYTFDKDSDGKSVCRDKCAQNWPAAIAEDNDAASGDWTFVESHDGKRQWAYKGKPLYLFVKDTNPGDTNGDGLGGVLHLAKPWKDIRPQHSRFTRLALWVSSHRSADVVQILYVYTAIPCQPLPSLELTTKGKSCTGSPSLCLGLSRTTRASSPNSTAT